MTATHRDAFRRLIAVSAMIAMAVGCSGGSGGADATTGVKTATIVVTSSTPSMSVGTVLSLHAQALDASGDVVSGATIHWSSSDTNVVTVSSAGVASAKALGTAQIAASAEGKSGVVTLTVIAPVASVSVLPQDGAVIVGTKLALQAITYDAGGTVLTSRTVTWSTSAPGTATVDGSGNVTGVALGTATITATSDGKSGSTTIAVNPVPAVPVASVSVQTPDGTPLVGSTVTLQVTTYDANGVTLTGRTVTWTTSAPEVAIVDASGRVTCVAAGTVTITGTSEGKSGSTTLVVRPIPVASVTVSPQTANLAIGKKVTLKATTRDANGATLMGRTVTWSTSNSKIATVDASGKVTGVARGTVTITATSEGQTGSATVVVGARDR